MGNEAALTDVEIGAIVCRLYEKTGAKEIGELEINAHLIPIGRAIEQAVLQSAEVQAWKKDAERCAEYRQLLEGAAAVLANSAEVLEEGIPNECIAHEARSMAQTIVFALPNNAARRNSHDASHPVTR